MDSDDQIAACQPKIKSYAQKDYFEYAGAAGGFIDKYGYPFCRGRVLSKIEKDLGQYNETSQIFWASGACLVVRADLYHNTGGLDDRFFAHMEEIDLCWRLNNMAYKIMYSPESEVFHVGGGTLPNNSPFKLYLNYRNNLFLLYNNLPEGKLFPILFKRLILDGISAIIFLAQLAIPSFIAVLKAHFHFYGSLKELKKQRKKLLEKAVYTPKNIYPKSLVWNYFINKKKSFTDLAKDFNT
jgi:GT2 family glycosyltransferase